MCLSIYIYIVLLLWFFFLFGFFNLPIGLFLICLILFYYHSLDACLSGGVWICMGEEERGRTERIRGRVNCTEHIVWGKSIFNLKKRNIDPALFFALSVGTFTGSEQILLHGLDVTLEASRLTNGPLQKKFTLYV